MATIFSFQAFNVVVDVAYRHILFVLGAVVLYRHPSIL